jgi:hypothetical protein
VILDAASIPAIGCVQVVQVQVKLESIEAVGPRLIRNQSHYLSEDSKYSQKAFRGISGLLLDLK